MKKIKVIVIYPGAYQKEYNIVGNLTIHENYYCVVDEGNKTHYFPMALTIIEKTTN